ncbi:phenylalanine--tRNA ligase subunit alpha [Candidatus Woesearchaeota archaeon]|nr:phenylalanine--tRNA ligase subunit alpha [Candidatus Woesearchaeota archaeon]
MDTTAIKKIISGLHTYERKVLPLLERYSSLSDLATQSGLQEVEVMRALQWLGNKGIAALREETKQLISLGRNGERYKKEKLPEIRFLGALDALGREAALPEVVKKAGIEEEEVQICLGVLRQKAAIHIRQGSKDKKELSVTLTPQGEKLLEKETLEEQFLAMDFPLELSGLKAEELFAFEQLKKRRTIVSLETKKWKFASPTPLGKDILSAGMSKEIGEQSADRLTPALLASGTWEKTQFRRYNVAINVPKISGARKHPYARFLDMIREKFISLGFTEMIGPLVETEFWDMDALFMPQFHSARDIHGAYFIKEPAYGEIPPDIAERVKGAHERGKGTLSKGWNYAFDLQRTKRNILRTQGTALSARMLASPALKIPGKYFSIARCFRPDVIDATHLPDFNQVEGIIIDEGLNFQHLKGILRMFAEEFAQAEKIKIKPGYFPFTEPSAEVMAKHPELGWIELGGSGIFRPEVVKPLLGKEIPVLAWGIGIDRIAMFNLGIKDIRQLFSPDIRFLREAKAWS